MRRTVREQFAALHVELEADQLERVRHHQRQINKVAWWAHQELLYTYRHTGKSVDAFTLIRELPNTNTRRKWIDDVSTHMVQQAILDHCRTHKYAMSKKRKGKGLIAPPTKFEEQELISCEYNGKKKRAIHFKDGKAYVNMPVIGWLRVTDDFTPDDMPELPITMVVLKPIESGTSFVACLSVQLHRGDSFNPKLRKEMIYV